ncbi:MAG: IclR family transcriptional regulator [Proteobacteria bacterium]|nr:IclR family transcriptional regulator [Pseudomonadota bacterium]HQR03337.1 IclR family transcriptional regulator [Rhodocyclaceae bacterium]
MPTVVPAARRVLAALEVFAREQRELSNSEMARLLQLADSSCLDLMFTLHKLGYLARTAHTRRYYPTARLLKLAQAISQNDPMAQAAEEVVQRLTRETGETAFFGRLDGNSVRVVAVQQSHLPLRYFIEVGDRIACHSSAVGKAILGLLPENEMEQRLRRKPLKALASSTLTDPAAVMRSVADGRRQGWYEVRDEGIDGVQALAVSGWFGSEPVAISIAGPVDRFEAGRRRYVQVLREVRASTFGDSKRNTRAK